jgi:hypothetical protein
MDLMCCKSVGELTTLLLIYAFFLFGALFPDEDVCRLGSSKYLYLSTKLQDIRPQNTVIFLENNNNNFTLFLYNFTTKFGGGDD